ncbi:MAG: DNA-binding protein [Gallionella sp.]|nr:DNA-binding protein [Gallionella sp.]
MSQLKTLEQARNEFNYRGESVTGWSRKHGFNPESVKKVLNGDSKCLRGNAHRIAVVLGIKHGVIVES